MHLRRIKRFFTYNHKQFRGYSTSITLNKVTVSSFPTKEPCFMKPVALEGFPKEWIAWAQLRNLEGLVISEGHQRIQI